MCLYIRENLKNHKYTYKMKKFWKLLEIDYIGGSENTLELQSPYYQHIWKPGWNKADSVKKIAYHVDNGIHVYNKRKNSYYFITVPVYANGKDLVAYGYNDEAVFSKVFLYKEDYLKAFKEYENNL